jgi:hypothetical protein
MKKLFFKVIGLFCLLAAPTVFADVAVYDGTATTNITSVISRSAGITSAVFANGTGSAITLTLKDAPSTTLTYSQGAYTNNVQTVEERVTTFTNINGISQSSTNTTLVNTPTLVNASTANYATVGVFVIPANSTYTWSPPQAMRVGFGLAAYPSDVGVTATITYLPTR